VIADSAISFQVDKYLILNAILTQPVAGVNIYFDGRRGPPQSGRVIHGGGGNNVWAGRKMAWDRF
jgi:hypothetical protein